MQVSFYRRALRFLGAAGVILGLLANPWLVGRLLSADGRIEHPLFVALILFAELALIASGLYLLARPRRASVINLVLLAVSAVAALIFLEFGARAVVYGSHGFSWRGMASLRTLGEGVLLQPSEDKNIRVALKPNLDLTYRLAPVNTNASGMHDIAYPEAKPDGVVRIAVLGDSFTFPVGVALNNAYHTRLEFVLRGLPGGSVECLNFGVPGYYLRQYPDVLAAKAMAFEPDLILIGFCAENDHIPPPPGEFERPFILHEDVHPFLRSTLWLITYNLMHPHAKLDKTPTAEQEQYVAREFRRLKEIAGDVPVLVAFLANLPRDATAIERLALDAGLDFVDCSAEFEVGEMAVNSIFHPVDSHPNLLANFRFADTIAEHILRQDYLSSNSSTSREP